MKINVRPFLSSGRASTGIPTGVWTRVSMMFDMSNNQVIVMINGIRVTLRADAKITSRSLGRTSIQGINFFGNEFNSKFHIDNICITEVDSGFDDPTTILTACIGSCVTEELDLTGE